MRWVEKKPKCGDIVRVKCKFYYHYGLFEDAEHVIQFGLPDNTGVNPDEIEVLSTDVQTFLAGGNLETARLNLTEKAKRRSVKDSIAYAHEKIGMRGYNILHNNCEHFVNECVFGVAYSTMVSGVREDVKKKMQ